ncbi:hypothetical protein F4808DRAFT_352864 [Astrocystis sublimbata]|nr:hypothetical protein F4808DRAFT_352864 [Astrocystis sublimbata]
MERPLRKGALQVHTTIRTLRVAKSQPLLNQCHIRHQSSTPSVVQASFWRSLIPKAFRPKPKSDINWGTPETTIVSTKNPKSKSKEWNPATFFLFIFLFIGSMSIQMIALKRDYATFLRRAEVRIGLLREVVEKLQRGEEVDVEKELGTGDTEKELQWEDVLREIERDDILKNTKKPATPKTPSPAQEESSGESTSAESPEATKPKASYSNFF